VIIVGADPGGSHAAIVVLDRGQLASSVYLDRAPDASQGAWLDACWVEARSVADRWKPVMAGVEDANRPNPHVGRRRADGTDRGPKIIDPGPTIETALCAGVIYAVFRAVCVTVMVPPDGFGAALPSRRHLLAAYPAELVGPRETTGAGKSKWQHLRAGYDVARATWRDARSREFLPAFRGS
jgi:hypothetical protein